MSNPLWSGDTSRKIISRIIVEGDLVLQTPAHFGSGDADDLTDMPVLVDPLDGKTPILTGASIAGALRSYLREREHGYRQGADCLSNSVLLFGSLKGNDEGEQSPLIVEDTLGRDFGIEVREGVRIDPRSRTAEEDKLFNLQLWQAGTTFPMRFELIIRESDDAARLKRALATTLEGFDDGSITLGGRKRRGYGRVVVNAWRVKIYDLKSAEGLCQWVAHGAESIAHLAPVPNLKSALGISALIDDSRCSFCVNATFFLDGSLLIRSGGGKDDVGPDMGHLHARQASGSPMPILSGTSFGGALRARGLKIANTLGTEDRARALLDGMFGIEMTQNVQPKASRVIISEAIVRNAKTDLVQNRISIDRLSGGTRETALFNEQPAFGGEGTTIKVSIQLVNPQDCEVGLLLLLLKDLWTGDLPLGGESAVGRGRLKGERVVLTLKHVGTSATWTIIRESEKLTITGDRSLLEDSVTALSDYLRGTSA